MKSRWIFNSLFERNSNIHLFFFNLPPLSSSDYPNHLTIKPSITATLSTSTDHRPINRFHRRSRLPRENSNTTSLLLTTRKRRIARGNRCSRSNFPLSYRSNLQVSESIRREQACRSINSCIECRSPRDSRSPPWPSLNGAPSYRWNFQ